MIKKLGVKKLVDALRNSVNGLRYLLKEETSFFMEILLSIPFLILIYISNKTMVEKILLFSGIFFVIFSEIINSGLEVLVDRISLEQHPLSKIVKDIGSLLVTAALIYFAIIWYFIFTEC